MNNRSAKTSESVWYRRGHMFGLFGAVLTAIAFGGSLSSRVASQPTSTNILALDAFKIVFNEEFDELSVSARGPNTRWIAHTPWHGDFGDAAFSDPEPGFPFTISDGVLRIEARKGEDQKWRSGLLSSRAEDGFDGPGFAQQFGYFEIRAKLPAGPGLWPAFWLIGVDKSKSSSEIDVLEQYGAFPSIYHVAAQIHKKDGTKGGEGQQIKVRHGVMSEEFNRYGVLIDPDWMTFYFNRMEVWRTQTKPEFHQPFYILLNLAMGGGWPIAETPNPSFMYVDYVKVFVRK